MDRGGGDGWRRRWCSLGRCTLGRFAIIGRRLVLEKRGHSYRDIRVFQEVTKLLLYFFKRVWGIFAFIAHKVVLKSVCGIG